jgi:glycerophosphoryl diester phosphodiesterase
MARLDWLTARPVAHRGLHHAASGIIENTPSAVTAAISANYAIEVDLQITADGEAMVYHDDALGRLTDGAGRLDAMACADLKRIAFRATADRMLTLGELCDLVAGRVTLVLEMKSHFDGDHRLVRRLCGVLAGYRGPFAVMSFDPDQVAAVREIAPALPRGIVAERWYRHPEWQHLPAGALRKMVLFTHALRTRPQFIAYAVDDLPALLPLVGRHLFRLPLLAWTIRSDDDRHRAMRWADQMIFEGFRP